jgi:hypothetical protein
VMASAFQQIVLKLVCLVVKKKGEIYSENWTRQIWNEPNPLNSYWPHYCQQYRRL